MLVHTRTSAVNFKLPSRCVNTPTLEIWHGGPDTSKTLKCWEDWLKPQGAVAHVGQTSLLWVSDALEPVQTSGLQYFHHTAAFQHDNKGPAHFLDRPLSRIKCPNIRNETGLVFCWFWWSAVTWSHGQTLPVLAQWLDNLLIRLNHVFRTIHQTECKLKAFFLDVLFQVLSSSFLLLVRKAGTECRCWRGRWNLTAAKDSDVLPVAVAAALSALGGLFAWHKWTKRKTRHCTQHWILSAAAKMFLALPPRAALLRVLRPHGGTWQLATGRRHRAPLLLLAPAAATWLG